MADDGPGASRTGKTENEGKPCQRSRIAPRAADWVLFKLNSFPTHPYRGYPR